MVPRGQKWTSSSTGASTRIPAGEWNGKRSPGLGEWVMLRSTVPVEECEQLATRFNPVKFNADEWVKLAKDAGMKYIVITSKHHDGFALFKSKASPYNIVDATPFKRDVLKELADACARGGIRLGFYYSQSQDWHEPNGAGNDVGLRPRRQEGLRPVLRGKAEPQVRELLDRLRHGRADLVRHAAHDDRRPRRSASRTSSATLQPDTLIDGRLGAEGDYASTGDNVIPPDVSGRGVGSAGDDQPHVGFRTDDTDWKSPGPDRLQAGRHRQQGRQLPAQRRADGRRRHPAGEPGHPAHRRPLAAGERRGGLRRRRRRRSATSWASRARAARRTCAAIALVYQQTQWRVTTKPGKLYITFFDEPRAPFALPAMKNTVTRAYRLADKAPVEMKTENGRTVPEPRAADLRSDGDGGRRRIRGTSEQRNRIR